MLPPWQPDSEVSHCPVCGSQFTFFYRKHHCRYVKVLRLMRRNFLKTFFRVDRVSADHCPGNVGESCAPHVRRIASLFPASS